MEFMELCAMITGICRMRLLCAMSWAMKQQSKQSAPLVLDPAMDPSGYVMFNVQGMKHDWSIVESHLGVLMVIVTIKKMQVFVVQTLQVRAIYC